MSFIIAIIVLSILKLTYTIGSFIAAKRLKLPVEKFVIGIEWGKPIFAKKFNDTEFVIYPLFFGGFIECSCEKEQKSFLMQFSSILTMVLCCIFISLIAINYVPTGKYETVVTQAPQLQAGDKILNVNGTNITGANTFKSVLNKKNSEFATNNTIVKVERNGEMITQTNVPLEEIQYKVNTSYTPKSEVFKNIKKNLTFKFERKSFTKNLISIIAMLALISILVLVHELGHFFAAKLFKIKVERFGFGLPFGPILWQKQCGETLLVVHAFLLGGYVSFPDDDKDNSIPKDSPERFMNKPIYQRLVVVSAGVFANILCAIFIVILTALLWGKLPTENYETFIKGLSPNDNAAIMYSGIKPDDKILEINGSPVNSAYAFQLYAIKSRKSDGMVSAESVKSTLKKLEKLNPKFKADVLLPAGTLIRLPKTVSEAEIHLSADMLRGYEKITDNKIALNDNQKALRDAAQGKNAYRADGFTTMIDLAFALSDTACPMNLKIERHDKIIDLAPIYSNEKGIVGVELDKKRVFVETKGLKSAVTESWNYLYNQTKMLLKGLWQLFSGKVSLDNMHGVIAVVKYGGDVIQHDGFWPGLLLTAIISLDLAIVNFLPIPALDGGHVMFLLIEKLYGKPLDEEMVNNIATAGFLFLILLMVIVIYNDIVALALHKI